MATPVGPAPRDPNDPDLWDWGEPDDRPAVQRHPARALLAAFVVIVLVALVIVGSL